MTNPAHPTLCRSPLLPRPDADNVRYPPILAALFLGVLFVLGARTFTSWFLYSVLGVPPIPNIIDALLFFVVMFAIVMLVLYLWLRFYERRRTSALLGTTTGPLRRILRGVLIGSAFPLLTVPILLATGNVGVDTEQSPAPVGLTAIPTVLIAAVVVLPIPAIGEEIVARGWLLQSMAARLRRRASRRGGSSTHNPPYPPHALAAAVICSSLAYALWHGVTDPANPFLPALNLFLFGLFWALYALKEGSLIGVCAAHTSYNWTQANLLGFDNYGRPPDGGSLLNLRLLDPGLLTGSPDGPSTTGGLLTTVLVLAALCLFSLLHLLHRRRTLH